MKKLLFACALLILAGCSEIKYAQKEYDTLLEKFNLGGENIQFSEECIKLSRNREFCEVYLTININTKENPLKYYDLIEGDTR